LAATGAGAGGRLGRHRRDCFRVAGLLPQQAQLVQAQAHGASSSIGSRVVTTTSRTCWQASASNRSSTRSASARRGLILLLCGQHRADTGRATGLAVAALHQFARALHQLGLALPQRLAEANAAGEVVVQINGRHELLQQLHRARVAFAAAQLATAALVGDREPGTIAVADRLLQVARIGHHRHGGDDVQRIRGAEEAIQRILLAGERAQQQRLRQLPPHRSGVQFLVGQVHRPIADVLVGVVADLLVAGHAAHHVHFAMVRIATAGHAAVETVQHLELGEVDAVGVVIHMRAGDVGLAAVPVQRLHLVGRGLHHVDGAFVQGERGGGIIDLGDDLLAAVAAVDHHEVAVGHRAQADRVGRIAVGDPFPALAFAVDHFGFGQRFQEHFRIDRAEAIADPERQLEGRAADVVEQDQRLVRRDARMFGRGLGEEVRMPHHVLVQRLRAGHHHPSAGCWRRPARPKRCQVAATLPG
jgi:hypothetical protein